MIRPVRRISGLPEPDFPLEVCTPARLFQVLQTSSEGLSQADAEVRLRNQAGRTPQRPEWLGSVLLLLAQFKSPLVLLLVLAVALSAALGEATNALLIFSILLLTGALGFWQEYKADKAVKKLRALVHTTATVKRDGVWKKIDLAQVAPGDLVRLSAGDLIPGDCLLLSANDLHVNEATLTGESFPVEKKPGVVPEGTPLNGQTNVLFQGSSVINGAAEALVVRTGPRTELGKIAGRLQHTEDQTAFEKGISRFGYMVMQLTFLMAVGILVFNLLLQRPVVDSILFSLALAVGMAPELLPAIMVTTLAAGAKRMAEKDVIVKKLSAIQNLGAIDVLCCDKTGTLTTGVIEVEAAVDWRNLPSERVRRYAWLNAFFETGFSNPLDEALRNLPNMNADGYSKFDEVPWDFIRKRLSIVVAREGRQIMITKGALQPVLDCCALAEDASGATVPIGSVKKEIKALFKARSAEGFRAIGVACKEVTGDPVINKDDEQDMTFLGFVFLFDPPKPAIGETVKRLSELGIALKIITGDNRLVSRHTASLIGLNHPRMLTNADLRQISDEALPARVQRTDLFVEVEPYQKERLIRAFRRSGNITGYLGDGINDATALRAADVGISVDTAVDIAKEASDMILMGKNLNVLRDGILEGRKTYLNTLKYIFITTSANLGNMISLAGISLFIPFLPLLPQQILLLNFLSDIPALGIAGDRVDQEQLARPRRWNLPLIRRFMMVFGLQSSLFDFLTFSLLLLVFRANEALFQSSWFLESTLSELLMLLIVRTVRPALRSRPSRFLMGASIAVALLAVAIPYLPFSAALGFRPLPAPLLAGMLVIALLYGVLVDRVKQTFFRRFDL